MSYQGWRRGTPYERPGNQGGFNQRRGKPRPPFNQSGPRPTNSSPQGPRPQHHTPPHGKPSNAPKIPTPSPTQNEKKPLNAPKVEVKNTEEKTATEPTPKTTTPIKTEPAKTGVPNDPPSAVADATKNVKVTGKNNSPAPIKNGSPAPGKGSAPVSNKQTESPANKNQEAKNTPPPTVVKTEPISKPVDVKPTVAIMKPNEPEKAVIQKSISEIRTNSPRGPESPADRSQDRNQDRNQDRSQDRQQGDRSRGRPRPGPQSSGPYQGRPPSHQQMPMQGKRPHSFMEKQEAPAPRSGEGSSQEMETDAPPQKLIDINDLIRPSEKKFSSRCRLFVAGLPSGFSEDEFCKLFQPYGDTTEAYINKEKNFGFIRLDYRVNSEIARNKLDGSTLRGRRLQVRFASNASAIEVHGLGPFVTDDLLEQAFSKFGAIERATVVCDDRGKSKEYGIVEFSYKKSSQKAIQSVNQGLFVLGKDPKPVSVKLLVTVDEESGVKEVDVERKPGYAEERDFNPRFVGPGTFEYELAQKWKAIEENEKVRIQELANETKLAKEELENEIANAMHLREEDMMRQELMKKEEELRQLEELKQMEHMRLQEQLRRLEQKRLDEEQRRQEDLKRKQSELLSQGDFRKIQEMQRQDDFRRQADMGRRPDDMRGQDDRRRSGDMRQRDDNRGRPDDNRGRPGDNRMSAQGGIRSNDMNIRRMDDAKRKDGFPSDDSKMDLPRGRGQQEDRGSVNPMDGNMPALQPPPPLPSLMTSRANTDGRSKFPGGMMQSDYRSNNQGIPSSGSGSNIGQQQLDALRGFNPSQMGFPRGLDIGRQGYPSPGGPQGYDSSPGRMPFGDQGMMPGLNPGDMPGQGLPAGIMPNQPRLPPPPAIPGGLARPLMDDQMKEGNYPQRFEPRFGEKRKRIL